MKLAVRDPSLSSCVDFALTNNVEPAQQKPLPEAVTEYLAAIRKHYLDLKDTSEAELFFGILPRCAGGSMAEVLPFPRPHDPALSVMAT